MIKAFDVVIFVPGKFYEKIRILIYLNKIKIEEISLKSEMLSEW